MIKINSFYPTDNFTRKTWEFYDDKLVVKTKSLTFEYENEIKYEKIKVIRNKRMVNLGWLWVAFTTAAILGGVIIGLDYFHVYNPAIQIIEKAIAILVLIFIIPIFHKDEYYSFLDADNNYLTSIKIDNKSRKSLSEAINLVKNKTKIVSEVYVNNSLPNTPPVYEFTILDFPDFLSRSTVRFYEDKFIDVEKSLAEELTTVIKYDELSGKTKTAKMGNSNWSNALCNWGIFLGTISISLLVLFPKQIYGNWIFLRLYFGGLLLLIPMFLLKYIKSEILLLYDNNDEEIFWTRINSANREKLNQIIGFIQKKVSLRKPKRAKKKKPA